MPMGTCVTSLPGPAVRRTAVASRFSAIRCFFSWALLLVSCASHSVVLAIRARTCGLPHCVVLPRCAVGCPSLRGGIFPLRTLSRLESPGCAITRKRMVSAASVSFFRASCCKSGGRGSRVFTCLSWQGAGLSACEQQTPLIGSTPRGCSSRLTSTELRLRRASHSAPAFFLTRRYPSWPSWCCLDVRPSTHRLMLATCRLLSRTGKFYCFPVTAGSPRKLYGPGPSASACSTTTPPSPLRAHSGSPAMGLGSKNSPMPVADRLYALRQLMKDRSLDAFIVYSGDAHGSEIPAACDERRQFLTGFDGSSGVAVVTAREALLWTDGRYFVQAEQQLDPALWTLMKQNVPGVAKVQEWLANKPEVKRVGVEGCSTPISEYRQLLRFGFVPAASSSVTLTAAGEELLSEGFETGRRASDGDSNAKEIVILSESLVDRVWGDARPAKPSADIHVHPLQYAGSSIRQKHGQMLKEMRRAHCDVLLLSALDDIAWFLNLRGADIPCSPVFLSYCLVVDCASAEAVDRDSTAAVSSGDVQPRSAGAAAGDESPTIAVLYTDEERIHGEVAQHLSGAGIRVRPYEMLCKDIRHVSRNKASYIQAMLQLPPPHSRQGRVQVVEQAAVFDGTTQGSSANHSTAARMLWLDPAVNVEVFATATEGDSRVALKVTPAAKQKAVKNAAELEGMKEAHIDDGVALAKFFTWISQQAQQPLLHPFTEWHAAQLVNTFRSLSSSFKGLSFSTIASVDANAAVVHYRPTKGKSAPLTTSSLFLLDSGAHYAVGGTTDVTRTVHLSTPTEKQKRYFTLGFIALSRQSFPQGTRGPQLDVLARQYLWQSGLDYRHGTGHGVGSYLNVHEGPVGISPRLICQAGETDLAEGNVLSVEPGYYEKDNFGIRIENLVYITKAAPSDDFENMKFLRFEQLTMVPIQKELVLLSLLNNEEIQWLNSYHQCVWANIAPRLQQELHQGPPVPMSLWEAADITVTPPSAEQTLRWLEAATAPLPLH
ncbi:creatinase domain-containing protein [Cystoisospora suis]|uniref:Creatinase domain-containing protein n=1 Tax=Cystoisospora suis TaxID=483139 RepID=A0A2C6KQE9_9APIC|nr:creatinase domain-containing protein [Cystoisospora suis]